MAFHPTDEQQQILTLGSQGNHLVIEALAGAGKTSTLEMLSHRMKGKGLYLAFNRAIAKEAQARFAANVTCRTFHGFAFAQLGHEFADRLEGEQNGQLSPLRIEREMSLRPLGKITPLARASLIRDTMNRYMQSTDDNVSTEHVPTTNLAMLFPGNTQDQLHALNEVARDAADLWSMIWRPGSKLPVGHDAYLKKFCLTRPSLPFDYVTIDEGQDLSPLMIEIITRQPSQRIVVGDSHQQIYEWRGASSALDKVPDATTCYLTQSFRFGDNIASLANVVLGNLHAKKPVRGFEASRDSLVGPEAILFRSNMALFGELMKRSIEDGQNCHIAGGAKDMIALLGGVVELKSGKPSTHPDLAGFSSWASFRRAAKEDGAPREMQQLVKVASSYPQNALIHALRKGSRLSEARADIILSTAHKTKGREFPVVRLGGDFPSPSATPNDPERPFEPEEARLAYVAITRAQKHLRGHKELVEAYRTRLMAMIENQRLAEREAADAKALADELTRMTPEKQREALRLLSTEQKAALNNHLTTTRS